jgi:hypothetical protein
MKILNMFLIGMVIGFMVVALFNTIATNSVENLQQYEQTK